MVHTLHFLGQGMRDVDGRVLLGATGSSEHSGRPNNSSQAVLAPTSGVCSAALLRLAGRPAWMTGTWSRWRVVRMMMHWHGGDVCICRVSGLYRRGRGRQQRMAM
jgi:hypothetical protein